MSGRYDVIVIGGGAGGLTAASGASAFGSKTALVHDSPLGGDCLWTGCVPSKSLLHVTQTIQVAKGAERYGFTQTSSIPFSEVRRKIQQSIEAIQQHDDPARFRQMGIDLYEGKGELVDPHRVSVNGGQEIVGDFIILATGSRPFIPPIPGLAEAGYVTNETFLDLSELPKKWVVIGAGPLGLEFSQALTRLGCQVTVVEQGDVLLSGHDQDTVEVLRRALTKEGIEFLTGSKVLQVRKKDGQVVVSLESDESSSHQRVVDRIFLATGRVANTEGLGLEKVGITTEKGAIPVNPAMQTKLSHIYAVGDVNGRMPFTHVAGAEAKIAVSHALFKMKRKLDYDNVPRVTYTDPELFQLGLTEEEAKQRYGKIKIYSVSLDQVDRFITDEEQEGMMKIISDQRGRILGAHAVGKGVGDLMQEVVFAKTFGHRIGDLSQVIHPYPSHVESVQKTADLYWREKLFSGPGSTWLKRYARWLKGWRRMS